MKEWLDRIGKLATPVLLAIIALAVAQVALNQSALLDTMDGWDTAPVQSQGFWSGGTQHTFQSAAVTNTNGTAFNVGSPSYPSMGIQVEGISGDTVSFQGTIDNSTWYAVEVVNMSTGAKTTSTTADGVFRLPVGELRFVRTPISGYSAGTITVKGNAPVEAAYALEDTQLGAATDPTYIGDVNFGESLPAGTNNIGDVDILTNVAPAGKAGSINYVNEPAANTAAQIVLAAPGSGVSHIIGLISWSYDSLPDVGSTVIIEDETGNLFKLDIDESGPGFIPWNPGLKAAANDAVTVTLAAGGSGINGIVNLHTWSE